MSKSLKEKKGVVKKTPHRQKTAPFGVRSQRFNVKGLHPDLFGNQILFRTDGSVTYNKRSVDAKKTRKMTVTDVLLERFESLRTINVEEDNERKRRTAKTNKRVEATRRRLKAERAELRRRARQHNYHPTGVISWKRQLESERSASLPHVLYADQFLESRERVRRMGPGKYETVSFLSSPPPPSPPSTDAVSPRRPPCRGGVMCDVTPRFAPPLACKPDPVPPVGSYGVPSEAMEERRRERANRHSAWSRTPIANSIYNEGSGLPPGLYNTERHLSIDRTVLERRVSERGPYELFSGQRFPPAKAEIARTVYVPKTKAEEMEGEIRGRFSTCPRWSYPTGRLPVGSNAHSYYKRCGPGPTAYTPKVSAQCSTRNQVPFLFREERFCEASGGSKFRNALSSVGPGTYFETYDGLLVDGRCHQCGGCWHRKPIRFRKGANTCGRATTFNRTTEDRNCYTLNLDSTQRQLKNERPCNITTNSY